MTTAARPTWTAALGGRSVRENATHKITQVQVRELPHYTKLKLRQSGQNTEDDLRLRDLKRELELAEQEYRQSRGSTKKRLINTQQPDISVIDDVESELMVASVDDEERAAEQRRRAIQAAAEAEAAAASTESSSDSGQESDSDEDDSDDDEEDTAELLRELEKIKRERAEERQRQEQERLEQEMKQREEEILTGNPLLASGAGTSSSDAADFTVKRRWDDDVVFRNQSRSVPEKPEQRFINDLLRSDFHRKFMSKYIK